MKSNKCYKKRFSRKIVSSKYNNRGRRRRLLVVKQSGAESKLVPEEKDVIKSFYDKNMADLITKTQDDNMEFASFIERAPIPLYSINNDRIIVDINQAWLNLLGYERDDVIGKKVDDFIVEECRERFQEACLELYGVREVLQEQFKFKHKNDTYINVLMYCTRQRSKNAFFCMLQDTSAGRRPEVGEALLSIIMGILNKPAALNEVIHDILKLIKTYSKFEALGIRLKSGEDYPYYDTLGFSPEFMDDAKYLCDRDEQGKIITKKDGKLNYECLCCLVIEGQIDTPRPFFTKYGSFWTNSISALMFSSTDELFKGKIIKRCQREGYESLALIPIRSGDMNMGLLQISDKRKNLFNPNVISYYESLCSGLGLALKQVHIEKERLHMFNLSLDLLCIAGFDGYFKQINPAWSKTLGWTNEELLNRPWIDFVHPDDRKNSTKAGAKLISGVSVVNFKNRYRCKDGSYRWFAWNSYTSVDDQLVYAAARDITDSIEINEALKQSEAKYKRIFNNIQDGYFETTLAGTILELSPSNESITGTKSHEAIGHSIKEYYADTSEREALIKKLTETGEIEDYEINIKNRNGTLIPCSVTAKLFKADQNEPEKIIGTIRNISKRKKAKKLLLEEKAFTEAMLDSLPGIFYLYDENLNLLKINNNFPLHSGYTVKELYQMSPLELFRGDEAEKVAAAIEKVFSSGEVSIEVALTGKDGQEYPYYFTGKSLTKDGGKYMLGIGIDISKRKKAEHEREKLIKDLQQALAKVKTLSGLLPICSYCKKVRDDKGYWEEVDSFIRLHSSAEFTHSVCPDCMARELGKIRENTHSDKSG